MAVFDICVYDTRTDMYMHMYVVMYSVCSLRGLTPCVVVCVCASEASALAVHTALYTQPLCRLVLSHVTFVT